MRKPGLILAILLTMAAVFWSSGPVQAERGIPGSPEFGYGARLELDGPYLQDALEIAADLPLDWISVDLHWSAYTTSPAGSPAWQKLDWVMQFAGSNNVAVMASIQDAPPSAMTANGPDPAQAASFVLSLTRRYPSALKAVELFPAANTSKGWGSQPNAQAYARLFTTVQSRLGSADSSVLLVAAGLKPTGSEIAPGEVDDITFLQEFYLATNGVSVPVISLQVSEPTGDPLSPPDGIEHRVLRHYEEVRKIMDAAGRSKDLIWVTSCEAPSGKISVPDRAYNDINKQTYWLSQAYSQLRSQLYIGVTFYQSLNPSAQPVSNHALIQNDQQYHPFYGILRELITQNTHGSAIPLHGRPKNEALDKHRP